MGPGVALDCKAIQVQQQCLCHGVLQMRDVKLRCDGGMKPGSVVINVAQEEKADIIVMGTRGMGKIRRTILGSVSDYVVHHATCPVVVCRQQAD